MATTRKPSAPKKAPAKKAEPVKLTLVPAVEPPEAAKMSPAVFLKGYEDMTVFGKENFDALVQSNAVLAKGLEDLGLTMVSLTQAHMEDAASMTKAMLTAKTFQDVVELQTTAAKTGIEKLVAESSKLSEMGMKVASDAIAPISARMNCAVEKMLELAAA